MACDNCGCSDITVPQGIPGIQGPTGPTGPAGATGAAGTTILANQYPNLATLGTSFESLAEGRTPYVLTANTLSTNGDALVLEAVFTQSTSPSDIGQRVKLMFNGSTLSPTINYFSFAGNLTKIILQARISRISNTTAKVQLIKKGYMTTLGGDAQVGGEYSQTIFSLAGLNWTSNAYNIDAQADSVTIGDITCESFTILKQKI